MVELASGAELAPPCLQIVNAGCASWALREEGRFRGGDQGCVPGGSGGGPAFGPGGGFVLRGSAVLHCGIFGAEVLRKGGFVRAVRGDEGVGAEEELWEARFEVRQKVVWRRSEDGGNLGRELPVMVVLVPDNPEQVARALVVVVAVAEQVLEQRSVQVAVPGRVERVRHLRFEVPEEREVLLAVFSLDAVGDVDEEGEALLRRPPQRVLEHRRHGRAERGFGAQEALEQVRRGPEGGLARARQRAQVGVLAPRDAGVALVPRPERVGPARERVVKEAAERPRVDAAPLAPVQEPLRCLPARAPGARAVALERALSGGEHAGEPHVRHFGTCRFVPRHEHVLGLEIPVHNPLRVQRLQARTDVAHERERECGGSTLLIDQSRCKLARLVHKG
mmetsp:Transcript_9969/g.32666  ORF Transcript_9969/g.32666 Transcript_9969/m.32666 type:complete len:392 (-) Transcript_9969:322-1497(-)